MLHMTELLQNFSNVIVFIILANRLYPFIIRTSQPNQRMMIGILFGVAGWITMQLNLHHVSHNMLDDGISVELKAVLSGMSGLLGGPVAGLITAAMIGVWRWQMGGIGIVPGMIAVLAATAAGALLHLLYRNRKIAYERIWWAPLLFGAFIALVQLATASLFLPPVRQVIISELTVPLLLVFPLTALVFHYFMTVEWFRQNDRVFDRVTHLPRYEWMENRLKRLLRRRQFFSFIILHADRLRSVNDMHGLRAGESVLKTCAGRIKESLPGDATLCRLDGHRFAVSLPSCNMLRSLSWIVEMKKKLSEPYPIEEGHVHMTFSSGLAVYEGSETAMEEIYLQADTALRHAITSGFNQTVPYESRLTEQMRYRTSLEKDLGFALERDQLELHYQPQYELETGRLRGFEALLRWQHPDWGPIAPSEFIPLAESTGLIVPIGRWVLETACRMSRKLNADASGATMAVNISTVQLREADFPVLVKKILDDTGLSGKLLELELTESTLVGSFEKAAEQLLRLKELGVRLALDDFGVGYSSLSYLRRLPFDLIKIDRSFIEDIGRGRDDRMTKSIFDWVRELRYEVVAEGLESYDQLYQLKQWKCDIAQGYLFSRPMPEEDLIRYLRILVPYPIPGLLSEADGIPS